MCFFYKKNILAKNDFPTAHKLSYNYDSWCSNAENKRKTCAMILEH
uniref:Uncharacterized protein n=1 Tax=Arundo donax TaxID=35708 RepID=A0A0A9BVD0_ARUDO